MTMTNVFAHNLPVCEHSFLIYVKRMVVLCRIWSLSIAGWKNRRTFASSKRNNDIFNSLNRHKVLVVW